MIMNHDDYLLPTKILVHEVIRLSVYFAGPAPVPVVQPLVLLLVSRFPFPLPLSFRFASSLSTVALLALLVQIHKKLERL